MKSYNFFGRRMCLAFSKAFFSRFEKPILMTVPPALLSHESTEHYTPQYILDAAIACMSAIDPDPCSNSQEIPNVPAVRHYTTQDNGLVQPWEGRVFLNPPFGHDVEWRFSKLYQERAAGLTMEAIVLWKSATETAAWKTLTAISYRVCFPMARIRFAWPAGEERTGPTFSPALFHVGSRAKRFEEAFARIGEVGVVPWGRM
jgi:ParB family chromosome partitioning protein